MGFIDNLTRGTYEVKTKCSNCKLTQMTKIIKGHIASEVLENGKCINCGCKGLTLQEQGGYNGK